MGYNSVADNMGLSLFI